MCEWGRNTPGFAEISTKGRDGGWVKQADCLESNKTRRLRGPGSSFGTFDWFQRIGMGPSCRASLKLLIVGSSSPKISVYSKHISLEVLTVVKTYLCGSRQSQSSLNLWSFCLSLGTEWKKCPHIYPDHWDSSPLPLSNRCEVVRTFENAPQVFCKQVRVRLVEKAIQALSYLCNPAGREFCADCIPEDNGNTFVRRVNIWQPCLL